MMDTKMENTNNQSQARFKGRLQVSILSAYVKAITLIETLIENDLIIPACPLKLSYILSKRLPTVFAKSSSAGDPVNRLSISHLIRRLSRIWQDWSRPFKGSVYCCPLLSWNWAVRVDCHDVVPLYCSTGNLYIQSSKYSSEKPIRQWWNLSFKTKESCHRNFRQIITSTDQTLSDTQQLSYYR